LKTENRKSEIGNWNLKSKTEKFSIIFEKLPTPLQEICFLFLSDRHPFAYLPFSLGHHAWHFKKQRKEKEQEQEKEKK
jgi:hypothetical protein